MPTFTMKLVAAILGAASVATAIPQYPTHTTTSYAAECPTYTPEPAAPECQTKLVNADMSESFNQVPIWKEPWVVGTCKGKGDCLFTGEEAFEDAPLKFNGGGHLTTEEAQSQVGQSFTMCPRDYDYKLQIRSAVVGGDKYKIAEGTEITLIMQVGDGDLVRTDPIKLSKGKFSDYYVDIPGSAKGGKGFMFWTSKTAAGEQIMVDYVDMV